MRLGAATIEYYRVMDKVKARGELKSLCSSNPCLVSQSLPV